MQLLPIVDISKAVISIPTTLRENVRSTDTTDSNQSLPVSLSTTSQGKRKAANANRKNAKKRVVEETSNNSSDMVLGTSYQ
jgi:hypothetical protein